MKNLKKITACFLSIILVLSTVLVLPVTASAANDEGEALASGVSGDCKWTLYGQKLYISGNGRMADYSRDKKAPWISWWGSDISTLVISEGVTYIGAYAFFDCWNLTDVTLPESSLTEIGDYAFNLCESLTQFTIPDSVKKIGQEAFAQCTYLSEVNGSGDFTYMGSDAFLDTAWLRYYPKGLVMLGKTLVGVSGTLDEGEVEIPDGTVLIAVDAMEDQQNITSVKLPESIRYIGASAFVNCSKLKEINLPNGLIELGTGAFTCSGLTSVVLPDNIKRIGEYTFKGCGDLTEVTLAKGTTYIGVYAFNGCKKLKKLNNAEDISFIGTYAFLGSGLLLNQPDGAYYIGKVLIGFKGEMPSSFTVKEGTKSIGAGVFNSKSNIEYVDLPEGLESIDDYAFQYSGIKEIIIPDSCKYIGMNAFDCCNSLEKAVVSGSEYFGSNAFRCCTSLKELTLNNCAPEISGNAFIECTSLEKVDIPEGVVKIGRCAFQQCEALEQVTLPESLEVLGEKCFYDCDLLKELWIPKSVNEVGDYAFGRKYCETSYFPDYVEGFTAYVYYRSEARPRAQATGVRTVLRDLAGDANEDGAIDVLDASAIQKYTVGSQEFDGYHDIFADVNADGTVDILDAMDIQKFASGKLTGLKKSA